MVGFPNKPMGFLLKNHHFGLEIGGTTILGKPHMEVKIPVWNRSNMENLLNFCFYQKFWHHFKNLIFWYTL